MNFSVLLEEALEERGNAVLVIARPVDGEHAVIQNCNRLFARMMGQADYPLVGRTIGSLRGVVSDAEAWVAFIAALRGLVPAELDMRLQGASPGSHAWLGFGLTFKADQRNGGSYGVLIGRDITQARRNTARDNESQRLLAAIFLRTSAALLVVRPDGGVLMANPAFQRLLGYNAEEVLALNARDLTTGRFNEIAGAARAQQLRDGRNYEVRMETTDINGVGVPVRLSSALVHDSASGSLRVVTLIPDAAPPQRSLPPGPVKAASRSVGQLHAISLAAFKAAFADTWPRVASRAMLMAEQMIRRRLGAADVLNRSDDHGFVVWFDGADEDANDELLARAAREIKLKFLSEFGEAVAASVNSVVVGVPPGTPPFGTTPPPALLESLQRRREEAAVAVKRFVVQLEEIDPGPLQPITDREARLKAIGLVDFSPLLRRQAASMAATLMPADAVAIDLRRLDLGLRELLTHRGGNVLVPIAWRTLVDPVARRAFDERVARIAIASRARLQVAVYDVPPLPNATRWTEVVGAIRRGFGEVALMMTLETGDTTDAQEIVAAEWPLSLLVMDATAAASMSPDGYFGVMAAARHRDIAVLARVSSAADLRDWLELGATMFAVD